MLSRLPCLVTSLSVDRTVHGRAVVEAELAGQSLLSLRASLLFLCKPRAVVGDCPPAAQYHADEGSGLQTQAQAPTLRATGVYGGLYNWVRHFTDLKNESVQGFPPDSKDPAYAVGHGCFHFVRIGSLAWSCLYTGGRSKKVVKDHRIEPGYPHQTGGCWL